MFPDMVWDAGSEQIITNAVIIYCYCPGLGYMKDYPYERLLRDSRILLIFEVSLLTSNLFCTTLLFFVDQSTTISELLTDSGLY